MWIGSPGRIVTTPSGSLGAAAPPPVVQAPTAMAALATSAASLESFMDNRPPHRPRLLWTRNGGGSHGDVDGDEMSGIRRGDPAGPARPSGGSDGDAHQVAGGPQVAAEAMPYDRQRRADCKTGRPALPMSAFSPPRTPAARSARGMDAGRSDRVQVAGSTGFDPCPTGLRVSARHEPPVRTASAAGSRERTAPPAGSVRPNPFEVQTRQRGLPDPARPESRRRSARCPPGARRCRRTADAGADRPPATFHASNGRTAADRAAVTPELSPGATPRIRGQSPGPD